MIFIPGDPGGDILRGLRQANQDNWNDRLNAEKLRQQYVTTNKALATQDFNIYDQNMRSLRSGDEAFRANDQGDLTWRQKRPGELNAIDAAEAARQRSLDRGYATTQGQTAADMEYAQTLRDRQTVDRMLGGGSQIVGDALADQAILGAQQGAQQARGNYLTTRGAADFAGAMGMPRALIEAPLSRPDTLTDDALSNMAAQYQQTGWLEPGKRFIRGLDPQTRQQFVGVVNADGSGAPMLVKDYLDQRELALRQTERAMLGGLAPTVAGGTLGTAAGNRGGRSASNTAPNIAASAASYGVGLGAGPIPPATQQGAPAPTAQVQQPLAATNPQRIQWGVTPEQGAGQPGIQWGGARQAPVTQPQVAPATSTFAPPPGINWFGPLTGLQGGSLLQGGTPEEINQELQATAQAYQQRWGQPLPPQEAQRIEAEVTRKHQQIADYNARLAAAALAKGWAEQLGLNPNYTQLQALMQALGPNAKQALDDAGYGDLYLRWAMTDNPMRYAF